MHFQVKRTFEKQHGPQYQTRTDQSNKNNVMIILM
jgi:hypothetical protein